MSQIATRTQKAEHVNGKRPAAAARLQRETFTTSRLLDFFNRKELIAQTGHKVEVWPLVALKELVDNALDACEDVGLAPEVTVQVDERGITVADNGPGIPEETVTKILDFSVRVSSREAYVSPTRGAQGNALKTILAMPFVLHGKLGQVVIETGGIRHVIGVRVDPMRQEPVLSHRKEQGRFVQKGTRVQMEWPDSACSILKRAEDRFVQMAGDYAFMNPHLTLHVSWFDKKVVDVGASNPHWSKWLPSTPTSPHWYGPEHFKRLVSAYLVHDAECGRNRKVREFIAEFSGLTRSAKQKAVLAATGLARADLSALRSGEELDLGLLAKLLAAMKAQTKPIKPVALGIIGKDHLAKRFSLLGAEMASLEYKKVADIDDENGLPFVLEIAFAWCPESKCRRLITGVNWSPAILNPFRELGKFGRSLDALLVAQKCDADDPVVLVFHLAYPRIEFTDRGKSAVLIGGSGRDPTEDSEEKEAQNDGY
jgi:DNA topoisomerase VI subunit B